jgi:hypothetical protein
VPEVGKIYSFNEGNYAMWDEPTRKYMDSLKEPSKWGGKPYSARYIGSLVSYFCTAVSWLIEQEHITLQKGSFVWLSWGMAQ